MKTLLGFSLFALVAVDAAGVCASAQTYPTRPVTFVVPFAPGGGTEFLARLLGQRLEQRLGKPFVIENRPGGGGVTGALSVARAVPDGYTILMAPSPVMAINVALHKKLPYDPTVDFVPVACCRHPLRARGHAIAVGAIGRRPHRARQGQARPALLRFGGAGHATISLPSCSRA